MTHHLVSDESNSYISWLDRIRLKLFPKRFTKTYALLLVALSSSFFYLSWCSSWFGFLLCVAIVPMLAIMKLLATTPEKKIFCWMAILLTLFLWNTSTVWWIYKAAFEGFLFAACYNTICLALPWLFYYHIRKWGGLYLGYLGLVTSWLTLEHAHLSWTYWELTFPWLNLGNGLAALPQWIQWYEYTGILGGSLWILTINILLYHLLFEKASSALVKGFLGVLLLPIAISFIIYYTYKEKGMDVEAVVVQPNFDSYTEKNSGDPFFVPYAAQINRLLTLSKEQLTPATALVIWPESAIDGCWLEEKKVHYYLLMQPIFQFLETYPSLHLISGASSKCIYGPNNATETAELINGEYIDIFNSVFYLKAGRKTAIYHKVKRLPGGEYIPYLHLLSEKVVSWIRQRFLDIGAIDPNLGKGDAAKVFEIDADIKVAPIICYELLYGAFAGSSVQQGANLFAVTTNDGWWGNTPIYHQFFQYSRLIAIAHRRSVMRAANTGVSGFINQRGSVIAATNRLEVAAMRGVVRTNNEMTFYSLYGDYIGHIASWACLLLFCIISMMRWQHKRRKPMLPTA